VTLSNLKFPEAAQQNIGFIFRDENEGKAPPGAAFADPIFAADEG